MNCQMIPTRNTRRISHLIRDICLFFLMLGLHVQPSAAESEGAEEKPALTTSERKAVDRYKSQMLAIQTWLAEYIDSARSSEARAYRIPVLISKKLADVRTKGLPVRIAEPLNAVKANVDAHAALLKGLPDDDAEAMEWMYDRLGDARWAAKMESLQAEQSDFLQKLAYAADPYGAGKESDLFQSTELSQYKDRWVVILGAYQKFEQADAEARKVAKVTKTPFSLRGMIYDVKGLRMPDDFEDEVYAGQYVQRRSNSIYEGETVVENHISVEDSSAYEGFKPGYFIGVGFIAESADEAAKQAAVFKKHAPGTYVKKTAIFMGCDR